MAEWFKATVLKTVVALIVTVSSNLTSSANFIIKMSNFSHYCSICEEHIPEFLPYGTTNRPNAHCLKCGSLERHRLFKYWFDTFKDKLSSNSRILHFAPEKCLVKCFTDIAKENYLSVDLKPYRAMKVEDITKLSFPDKSFDFIFCSHVLQHIPNDDIAMEELYRVLSDDGTLVLINTTKNLPTREVECIYLKREYNSTELKERLIAKKFEVELVSGRHFFPNKAEAFRRGIHPPQLLFICKKRSAQNPIGQDSNEVNVNSSESIGTKQTEPDFKILDIKDQKLGYYLVPKCGSRTVIAWQLVLLYPNIAQDNPAWFEESRPVTGYHEINNLAVRSKLKNFPIKFCIVRDPVERFLSAYTNRVLVHKRNPFIEIDDIIRNFDEKIKTEEYHDLEYHTRPLDYWLGKDVGLYDRIFNLREMDSVKKLIENVYGVTLPEFHLQKNGNIPKPSLTTGQINWIKERYKSDYEIYGRWF